MNRISSGRHDRGKRGGSGFTLIELLIVVAIIAILAAIAVPNFLEAQTRSKVSRVHNDLRACRTAIEAYAVDHNHYPKSTWGCPPFNDTVEGHLVWGSLPEELTTPIAYITRIFRDPFAIGQTAEFTELVYNYDTVESVEYMLDLDPPLCPVPGSPGLIYVFGSTATLANMRYYFGAYYLWSLGPAGPNPDDGGGNVDTYFLQYDPTNGTISRGRIFVTQKHSDPYYVPPNAFPF